MSYLNENVPNRVVNTEVLLEKTVDFPYCCNCSLHQSIYGLRLNYFNRLTNLSATDIIVRPFEKNAADTPITKHSTFNNKKRSCNWNLYHKLLLLLLHLSFPSPSLSFPYLSTLGNQRSKN